MGDGCAMQRTSEYTVQSSHTSLGVFVGSKGRRHCSSFIAIVEIADAVQSLPSVALRLTSRA